MNISNRVFGQDIHSEIKKKLKFRQALNESANFGDSIQSDTSDFKEKIKL